MKYLQPLGLILVLTSIVSLWYDNYNVIDKNIILKHQVDSLQAIQPVIVKEVYTDFYESNVIEAAWEAGFKITDYPACVLQTNIEFINQQCYIRGVDRYLVYAIIEQESKWINDNLMQVTPICMEGIDVYESPDNKFVSIYAGIKYLSYLQSKLKGMDSIIVAYNRGLEGMRKVKNLKNDPYYKDVMNNYKKYVK